MGSSSPKITIVCEAFSRRASGGRAALALAENLRGLGATLQILVTNPATPREAELWQSYGVGFAAGEDRPYEFLSGQLGKTSSGAMTKALTIVRRAERQVHLSRGRRAFRKAIQAFRPDVVHFASFDVDKPPYLIEEAMNLDARVVLQPWVHRYGCGQGFAYRDGDRCTLCFDDSFEQARRQGCLSSVRAFIEGGMRQRLRKTALHSHFLSTCSASDDFLRTYGADSTRIIRLALPFAPVGLDQVATRDDGYFIFHGQIFDYKGLSVLRRAIEALPETRFLICPPINQEQRLAQWGITKEKFPNLEIRTGVGIGRGLEDCLANAGGVLVPSLWDTTPEYALLEALYLQKPVVVFDVGTHSDCLEDGINAMVAPRRDTDGFIRRIQKLDASAELRNSIGRKGWQTFQQVWSSPAWREQLRDAYMKIGIFAQ